MGQKVHPYGFRLGYNKNWQSRWFSKKEYASFVFEDHNIRTYVKKLLYSAGVAKIEIERFGGRIRLILSTARPGIVIGRKGAEIEKLRADLKKKFGRDFALEVNEIRRPEIEAQLVAENIATQLERRVAFRRAMKRTVQMARKFGAEGIKISLRWPPCRCRNRPLRMVPRRPRAAADPACRHRLRFCRSSHHLWPHRHQGVGLQG